MPQDSVVAIDLGGSFIKSALVAKDGTILKSAKIPSQVPQGREVVLKNIHSVYAQVHQEGVLGIGIGSPGCVDPQSGIVSATNNIDCINGVSLSDFLYEKTKLPVHIDNDANAAAKGEYLFGIGSQEDKYNLLAITLGTGVGGGLILEGVPYRGRNFYAGEFGHVNYIPNGAQCSCGKRGCIEAYSSATAILANAHSMQKHGLNTQLKKFSYDEIDVKLICELAHKGDILCHSLIYEAAQALGTVIGSIINLLNLDCVVVGGGVAAAGEILFNPLCLYAERQTLPLAYKNCEIGPSLLGDDAALLGNAASIWLDIEQG